MRRSSPGSCPLGGGPLGLHTGEAIRDGHDLFGTSVAAARVMAKADGEQVLVSAILKAVLGM